MSCIKQVTQASTKTKQRVEVLCPICDKKFSQRFNMVRHLLLVHGKDEAGRELGKSTKRRFAAYNVKKTDEFERECKQMQRSSDVIPKTDRSLQLSNTLRNQSIVDNDIVTECVSALYRYLNSCKELSNEPVVETNILALSAPQGARAACRRRQKHTTTSC